MRVWLQASALLVLLPEAEVGDTDDVCCIAALTDIGPLPSGFILQRSLEGGAGVSYLYRVPPLQSR